MHWTQIIGVAMFASVIVAPFVWVARVDGVRLAASLFAALAAFFGFLFLAMFLASGGLA